MEMQRETSWLFELDGEASDVMALMPLASACNCTVRPGPDALLWLGGTRFDGISTTEKALEEAQKTLGLLNGLARLESQSTALSVSATLFFEIDE